jgi:glucose dehydrogenase
MATLALALLAAQITAANVASLRRQQVAIDGTVDASASYAGGVFFVTTTYGKTLAIDAASGAIRWE